MDETVHSLFEHRLQGEGDGVKTTLSLRGRGCGRKRKGTPVKVFVRDSREGAVQGKGAAVNKNKTVSPHKLPKVPFGFKSSSFSTPATPAASPLPTAAVSAQTPPVSSASPPQATPFVPGHTSSSPPAPNCRIREVHCGNQVRLVVIAIQDITKGEEITVDYSLIEWGENLGFRGSLSPTQMESNFEAENDKVKKEDEPLPLTVPHQEQVTSSWPLSPSTSLMSHSDASGSEREEEDTSPQGRTPQRRKKNRSTPSKKRTPRRTSPGRAQQTTVSHVPHDHNSPTSESLPLPLLSSPSSSSSAKLKAPLRTAGSTRGVSTECTTQTCEFCGRHFRSLGRHLDKHHGHQPEVCSALVESYTKMLHLQAQSTLSDVTRSHFPLQAKPSGEADAQDQSLDPPTVTEAHPSPAMCPRALTTPPTLSVVAVPVLKRSPTSAARTPLRKGGKKRSKTGMEDEEGPDSGPKGTKGETASAQSPSSKIEADDIEYDAEYDSGTEETETPLSSPGRPHMLPLLSSLSSLVLYLRRLQHSAFLSLSRQLQSAEAWRLLCHSSLSLLILYNRRRECEVSKLSISEYHARVIPQCPVPVPPGAPPALTPLEASLSPFERLVLSHLPRVGVQGKRGRIQPLILPPNCEPCLELLLQTREGVGVEPANPYMFARPYHSPATPLRGIELLRSLARSSGIRNPRTLTQAKVRRQVGILSQLLLLGEGEEPGQPKSIAVERLERFLEREYHVTQNCADIGQDPGLMGRVGRVVLCGERDGVLFRGMSLNHICLELDVMSENSGDAYSERESDGETVKEKAEPSASTLSQTPAPALSNVKIKNNRRKKKPKITQVPSGPLLILPSPTSRRGTGKRGVLKRPWSEAERAAVEEHLNQNITELRVPAKADCERCLQNSPLLVNNHRDWRAVKFYCHNRIQLLKKIQRRETQLQPLSVC